MACSTCHVIVDKDWYAKLPTPSEDEEDMLDLALTDADFAPGCQITIAEGWTDCVSACLAQLET